MTRWVSRCAAGLCSAMLCASPSIAAEPGESLTPEILESRNAAAGFAATHKFAGEMVDNRLGKGDVERRARCADYEQIVTAGKYDIPTNVPIYQELRALVAYVEARAPSRADASDDNQVNAQPQPAR